MTTVCSLNATINFVIDEVKTGFRDRRAKSGFAGTPWVEYAAYASMPGGLRCLLGTRDTHDGAIEVIEAFIAEHGLRDAAPLRERLCIPMTVGQASIELSKVL